MKRMVEVLLLNLRRGYAPLVPLMVVVLVMALIFLGTHLLVVLPAQNELAELEAEWTSVRQRHLQHVEAQRAQQELTRVLRTFPARKDLARLGMGITKNAQQYRVTLPSLSYRVESSTDALATKAVFQGSVSGRYEDLRRFIHELESLDAFLVIEDLDVLRTAEPGGQTVTFTMRIATYLRHERTENQI